MELLPLSGSNLPRALLGSRTSRAIPVLDDPRPDDSPRLAPHRDYVPARRGSRGRRTGCAGAAIVFPVLGAATYTDDFGDPRGQGAHEGNDMLAPRRALALAAEAGTVKFHTTSSRAGCMLYLDGESGTEYLYIHLNNDLTDTNDNQGSCVPGVAYAKGLKSGAKVAAGEAIGYVGDSGDANGIHPHLHFEVHPNGGAATSPFPYLNKARHLLFAAQTGTTFTLAVTGKVANARGRGSSGHGRPGAPVARRPQGQAGRSEGADHGARDGVDRGHRLARPAVSAYPALELLTKGLPVTVWTSPAKVTLGRALRRDRARSPRPGVVVKP